MTFTGNINIRQTGHSMLHIDRYDEDYLVPLPNAHCKGFLSGQLYPEIYGTYYIISSSGYVSEIQFLGASFFGGGKRNRFKATVYRRGDVEKKALYLITGQWSDKFTIYDGQKSEVVDQYDTNAAYHTPAPLSIPSLQDQDPWESRRAWQQVISALKTGDLGTCVMEKSKIEIAQRSMRAKESQADIAWRPLLFSPFKGDYELFQRLASATDWALESDKTKGIWKVDMEKVRALRRPFHGDTTPLDGTQEVI